MLINRALFHIQNSNVSRFISDSLFFENIDNICFIMLIFTILSTSFMPTGAIGVLATGFFITCLLKLFFKKGEAFQLSVINKIFVVYLLFVLISALGASYLDLSLKGLLKTIVYALFYFSAVYYLSENKNKIVPVLGVIALVTGLEGIIGIVQNVSHIEAIATWQDTANIDPTRVIARAYGTLKPYNPNLLAGYLVAGLPSIIAFLLMSIKSKRRLIFFGMLSFVIMYGIFTTGSRGAYLGLIGFFGVIFLYLLYFLKNKFGGFKKLKAKYKLFFALFVGAILTLFFGMPSFRDRIFSIFALRGDSSISFRLNVYQASYNMFLDNKILGIGVGNKNFREIYGLYMKTGFDALGTYSVPLEIAVESGIFALIAFFAFLFLIIIKAIKFINSKTTHPQRKAIVFSVLLMIVGVMFHGLFDTIFFRPQIQILFWTNIAIFHSLSVKKQVN